MGISLRNTPGSLRVKGILSTIFKSDQGDLTLFRVSDTLIYNLVVMILHLGSECSVILAILLIITQELRRKQCRGFQLANQMI